MGSRTSVNRATRTWGRLSSKSVHVLMLVESPASEETTKEGKRVDALREVRLSCFFRILRAAMMLAV